MPNLHETSLSFYRTFAANNLKFLRDVEVDLDFEESGGEVIYALDSSEVYGYTMGAAETFFFERGGDPFSEEIGRATLFELHEAILEQILFEQKSNYLLLPPYIIELTNFLRGLKYSTMQRVAKGTVDVARSINDLKQRHEYKELLKLAGEPDVLDAHSENNHMFRSRFQKAAPDLVEIWRATSAKQPIDRARDFIEQPFIQLSDLVQELTEPNDPVFQDWFSRLNKRRPQRENQNFLDAQAMGFLYSLNFELHRMNRRTKVVLISRSNALYQIASQDAQVWKDIGGQPIRHPRSFLNQITSLGTISYRKSTFEKRRNIAWWKNTYSAIVAGGRSDQQGTRLTITEITNRSLAVLIDVWKRFCSAQVSSRAVKTKGDSQDVLLKALHALSATGSIQGIFDAIIFDLYKELDKIHFNIPTSMEASDELDFFRRYGRSQQIDKRSPTHDDIGERLVVSSLHGTNLAYSIHIRSNKIRNLIKEHRQDPFGALAALTEAASSVSDADGDLFHAEWYLAMSYLYASISAWSAAVRFVEVASQNLAEVAGARGADRDWQISLFEVAYLKSKCARELGTSPDELLRTIDTLEAAIVTFGRLPRSKGKSAYLARARTESIKCLFELLKLTNSLEDVVLAKLLNNIATCRDNIASTADPVIEAQFLNNFCYHSVDIDALVPKVFAYELVSRDFTRFYDLSTHLYGQLKSWPENYLDTFCWVTFQLAHKGALQLPFKGCDEDTIFELLDWNAERENISDHDRQDFVAHKNLVSREWRKDVL
jgi:hypothetical protein